MKHIRSYLTLAVTLAILLSCLFVNLVGCDEAFVNSSVTLGPGYANHDKYWWIYNIDAGTTISIDITLQSGAHVVFYIKRGTNGERVYERNDLTTLHDTWVVPDTGNYICTVDNGGYGSQTSEVNVLIQKAASGGGGGFDPLPAVVIAIIILIALVSAFFILRMRNQPPPPSEAPPPPPP
jgi:hypothetical protein